MIELIALFGVIALILIFDFINGFHDTANQVSTVVATKVLKPGHAVILAGILNFIGPFVLGLAVANTIGKISLNPMELGLMGISAAVLSAVIWNLATWYYGIPSSSSHALVGGLVGAVIITSGVDGIKIESIIKTFEGLLLSPIAAFFLTLIFVLFLYLISVNVFKNTPKLNAPYKHLQLITFVISGIGHGGNDATKSMGIIGVVLLAAGVTSEFEIPTWVIISCATAIALGTAIGGFRIIRTMAKRLTKMEPVQGFGANTVNSILLTYGTVLGFPMSTTHVITGCIIGAGASKGLKRVKWGLGRDIMLTWIFTIPLTALIAVLIFVFMNAMLTVF